MDRKYKESQRLPKMVKPSEMCLFMCDDMLTDLIRHSRRDIDPGHYDPKDKRKTDIITGIDHALFSDRCGHFTLKSDKTDKS